MEEAGCASGIRHGEMSGWWKVAHRVTKRDKWWELARSVLILCIVFSIKR